MTEQAAEPSRDDIAKLRTATPEDFTDDPLDTHEQAWRHMCQAVAITLEDGDGISAVVEMLGQVIHGMEVEDADTVELWED